MKEKDGGWKRESDRGEGKVSAFCLGKALKGLTSSPPRSLVPLCLDLAERNELTHTHTRLKLVYPLKWCRSRLNERPLGRNLERKTRMTSILCCTGQCDDLKKHEHTHTHIQFNC